MRIIKLYEEANKNLTDINAQTASTGEIADAIQNGFEDAGKVISNDDAERLANDAKDLVDEVGAQAVAVVPAEEDFGDEYIVVDNQFTRQLDRCLERARTNMRKGNKTNCNLLVEGLPGSGKTAIVESWAKARGLILVPLNAASAKADEIINGTPMRDATSPEENKVATAFAAELDKLRDPANAGKCVLFVDEFNRQLDAQLRRSFLSLFNEKRNATGSLDFTKTLLFTVVCINPAGPQFHDKGVAEMNQAEKTRFAKVIHEFDSNVQEFLNFVEADFKLKLRKLGVAAPGSAAAEKLGQIGPFRKLSDIDLEDIEEEIKKYLLLTHILTHAKFKFDNRNDLIDANDEGKSLLNSRKLTELVDGAAGDADLFLDDLKYSDLLDSNIAMFKEILTTYHPDIEGLKKELKLVDEEEEAAPEETVETEVTTNTEEDEVEDDDKLFVYDKGTKKAIDPNDVISRILAGLDSF